MEASNIVTSNVTLSPILPNLDLLLKTSEDSYIRPCELVNFTAANYTDCRKL